MEEADEHRLDRYEGKGTVENTVGEMLVSSIIYRCNYGSLLQFLQNLCSPLVTLCRLLFSWE